MPTPIEVYNRRIKKREKEKNKKHRREARDLAKLLQEPEKLKEELNELSHKAIIGRIDPESLQRKEKLEKLWKQYCYNRIDIKTPEGGINKITSTTEGSQLPIGRYTEGFDSVATHCNSSSTYLPIKNDLREAEGEVNGEADGRMKVSNRIQLLDTSGDDTSSEDEAPKCIIEIDGKPIIQNKKVRRGFHDADIPDDFALELLNNAPKLPKVDDLKPEVVHDKFSLNNARIGTFNRDNTHQSIKLNFKPLVVNKVQYKSHNPLQQQYKKAPPPPVKNEPPKSDPTKDDVKPSVPISRYLVPSQVRINRNKL